ncbi:MAG: hypothetical protein JKY88_11105 [Pseudomonadales bacterium]|nr:hypothetical protein [Pseudomonadales bacterium]
MESNPSTQLSIKKLDYFILKPRGNDKFGRLDYLASTNCNISTYCFESLAIVRGSPPRGWLSVIVKPFSQSGIGPFHGSLCKSTTIKSSGGGKDFWTTDLPGGIYYIISIRASLLAKHSLGMVDTSILNTSNTLKIDAHATESLISKLKHIVSSCRSSAELDLRGSHLILAICESISDQSRSVKFASKHSLTRDTVNFIQKDKVSNAKEISQAMKVSKPKLDQAFKSSIGIGLNQFLNAYYLNLIRVDLSNNGHPLCDYAKRYGYKNVEILSNEYTALFDEDIEKKID